jgi:peptide deformylase
LTTDAVEYPEIEPAAGCKPEDHLHAQRLELINPIVSDGGKIVSSEEGCLSIPDYRDSIKRHETVRVTTMDRHGRLFKLKAIGLLAFCIQHEVDHLNGVLFTDHLSRLKKQLFNRWYLKHLAPQAEPG